MKLERVMIVLSIIICISGQAVCENIGNDSNSASYEQCKMSVAVVEGPSGSGTGFLCVMNGNKYFVTNRHVADQRGKIEASFIDGGKLSFNFDSPIDIAANRDLVRFPVDTDRPCLQTSSDTPQIGDRIEFYGNAEGRKVITMTAGKILAVGMERIEINSPIQAGNSGSPLVLANDGKVLGVTTLSTFNKLNDDPSKVGTRYDPKVKLTREFAVRFQSVEWESMSYGAFLKAVNVYMDYCKFYDWMKEVCISDKQALVFDYALPDLQFSGMTRLNLLMKKIAKCDEAWKKNVDRLAMMEERNRNNPGRIGGYNAFDINGVKKRIRDSAKASYKARKEVLENVLSYAKADKTLAREDKTNVVDAFDWMYRKYCEKYRRQLQGYDL